MRKFFAALGLLVGAMTMPVSAQGVPINIPAFGATASPYGFPIKRVNNLDTAPISFEGQRLFVIAAPAAQPDAAVPPIVQRVETITDNLQRIVPASSAFGGPTPTSRFDVKTFKVTIGSENGYPTLYATDGRKREVAPIMTLTDADATLNGVSQAELAVRWQAVLQTAIGNALLAMEPEHLAEQLRKLPWIIAGGILATLLIVVLRRTLRRRHDALEKAAEEVDPHETSDTVGAKRLRAERVIVSGALWILSWAIFAVWALIVIWVLGIVPATRAFANELTTRLIRILVVWVAIAVFDRLINVAIVRVADTWEASFFSGPDERARLTLRRPTIVRAVENLKSILLWAIAIIATLSIFSVSATSVLTIGAVIAFALSFATQSLIKDYLNGFLILAEDQFAIGDSVTINGFSGMVEDLTLRISRLRTDDGRLVTIPNSSIIAVENQTRLWSRVDFRVAVSATADVDRAIAAIRAALEGLEQDPAWSKGIVEPAEVLGVDSVSHAGVVLRAWMKTLPSQKAALARELNRRVNDALRKENIALGVPQSVVLRTDEPPETPEAAAGPPP